MNNNDDNLKLASVDYVDSKCSGGGIKSDKWYCNIYGPEIGTYFDDLIPFDKIKEIHSPDGDRGVVVFIEEMTQTQAADYLNTVALFRAGGESMPLCDYGNGNISAVCVLYPWPAGHTYPDGSPYVNGPAL